ncbi:hypothetical protein K491DRAFT_708517 [Lophiostoma macrostomum CBS 122681]|uniref:DUF8035 domain-containing protein n=1 Tax=Lophiostoma macrostomum CBS 122681 TaxID=1314788 RepID=A0A6A6SMD8_9PLEO|nr:hypothetical protein K491DRAFT_708517 [Lophiostoma macrostomum CBS 122681]
MGSVVIPSSSSSSSTRRLSYTCSQPPQQPARRHSLAVAVPPPSLQLKAIAQSAAMDSRHYRPSSPRTRLVNPNRSSTGTFADPYYDSTYYARRGDTSPRTSGERIGGSHQPSYASYAPSSSSGSRSANLKYDAYSGRPRRNTLNESDDRLVRTAVQNVAPTASIPIRAPAVHAHHHHLERPSSPLAHSWDNRAETYATQPAKREHKRIYSVDDNSHQAKLVSERDVVEPRRRDDARGGYSVTSGGRSYHQSKPHSRVELKDDDGYSYTDAAGMYRETEPAWRRRPRAGSIERGSRPTSMILDNGPRSSTRELGPPPSTRGFDRINNGVSRSGSLRHRGTSPSIERTRDAPKYDAYPEAAPTRSASTRHKTPAVHQEPREQRRDTYHDDYDRRDRDRGTDRRQGTADRFEDREVASRGFGIAPGVVPEPAALDRQPIWNAQEMGRARPEEYGTPYYPSERSDARMPEPRMPEPRIPEPRIPDPRIPRDRDVAPVYEERPRERERERDRRDRDVDERDRGHLAAVAPVAAAGAAATYGAAELLKSRDRDRERDRDRDRDSDREREREREKERDREKRREHDERDRRDRGTDERREPRVAGERRERVSDDRKDRVPEERVAPAAAAYASTQEPDRKPRERRYEDDDGERKPRERRYEDDGRDRKSRKAASSDDSEDDRPHHYADRDAARESDRRIEAPQESILDPDEDYRRRVQQELERSGRTGRDQENTDADRERERRRRKEERAKSRERSLDTRSRAEPPQTRFEGRTSNTAFDAALTQEPEPLNEVPREAREQSGKSVQIVAPPKEGEPKPKGILRKPTEKFPEHPDPIREGVAPHKSQLKGKDIPVDARWTKIDRRLVNPEALEEAKERFEERMDCVIVLRVLTKSEIQKLADRTKEIRSSREEEYDERHDRKDRDRDRDRRSHRSHRDDDDRDRGRRSEYDDTDEEDVLHDRDRERERPRMIEDGR